jgi:molybdate transport system regulatory protein
LKTRPKSKKSQIHEVRPRFRVICGEDIALGPGKAELLRQVAKTGSISLAAERMGMSYMRAWTLIKTMEQCFKEPLVYTVRGGREGGGAGLTETGIKAVALYEEMQTKSMKASTPAWRQLERLLKD